MKDNFMNRIINFAKTISIILLMIGWLGNSIITAQQKKAVKTVKKTPSHLTYEKPSTENQHSDHSSHQKTDEGKKNTVSHAEGLKVTKISRLPNQFVGNVIYSPELNRLWLLSFGPPANTKGPSVLFELDPVSGKEIARTTMPFLGEFAAPTYLDNNLYVGIPYESKIYKVSLDKQSFGQVIKTIAVPSLATLKLNDKDEPYRFPFLNFTSVAATPEKNLVLVADDTGYLVHIDKEDGTIIKTLQTIKGLNGAAVVSHGKEVNLFIANQDPETVLLKNDARRFMFRARHGFTPPYAVRTETPCERYGARDINWLVLDTATGEVLSASLQSCSRASAGSIAPISHEMISGTRHGLFKFYAIGDEGLVTVEWVPR